MKLANFGVVLTCTKYCTFMRTFGLVFLAIIASATRIVITDHVGLFVGWFVHYARCDVLKSNVQFS